MTLLETMPNNHDFELRFHTSTVAEYTLGQVIRYVEDVKPRLLWQEHLGRMALNHPNIFLGEE
jgi:hypothetical protein